MAEVPTGYLGPETSKHAELLPETVERVAISSGKRFEIFKRDNYRCQLCGAKAEDGAALHVDHCLAVAKGGSNDDGNLWALCDRCNLGKSDADL
jgi:5-methylcytosine-specific restriction endonuclease McrA